MTSSTLRMMIVAAIAAGIAVSSSPARAEASFLPSRARLATIDDDPAANPAANARRRTR